MKKLMKDVPLDFTKMMDFVKSVKLIVAIYVMLQIQPNANHVKQDFSIIQLKKFAKM